MASTILASEPKHSEVQTLDTGTKGKRPSKNRPHVCIRRCSVRLLDKDNLWASIKSVLDALCIAGLIPGDDEDSIALEVCQEKVHSLKEQGTYIEIDYGPDDGPDQGEYRQSPRSEES